MPTTYIDICNKVLRRINEVEIAPADFAACRGVQALVKDAVKAAVATINQSEYEWPFNSAEHSVTLIPGQCEYSWPNGHKVSDWNSFQIQKDDTLGTGYRSLDYLERDEWYSKYRDDDYEAGADGRSVPQFVFPSHGSGFGVTPSPDKAYSVVFRYFLNYSDLTLHDDVTRIPESFDTVLVDGAMYHLYMFRENPESAQIAWQAFQSGLKSLQTLYINNFEYIYDTRTRHGRTGR